MPDMTGYELARLILGRKLNRHLPIIFVSSHRTDGTDVMLGYEAGAVDYITKPFDPTVLRAKVAVFAELYRQRHALAAEAADLRGQNERLQQILATRRFKRSVNQELNVQRSMSKRWHVHRRAVARDELPTRAQRPFDKPASGP